MAVPRAVHPGGDGQRAPEPDVLDHFPSEFLFTPHSTFRSRPGALSHPAPSGELRSASGLPAFPRDPLLPPVCLPSSSFPRHPPWSQIPAPNNPCPRKPEPLYTMTLPLTSAPLRRGSPREQRSRTWGAGPDGSCSGAGAGKLTGSAAGSGSPGLLKDRQYRRGIPPRRWLQRAPLRPVPPGESVSLPDKARAACRAPGPPARAGWKG